MSAPARVSTAPALYDDARSVLRLVAAFESRTLPKVDWTHAAHLTMGFWYAVHLPADVALDKVRSGILRLNESHGVVSTPTSGYHETITRAYMRLIGAYLAEDSEGGEWHHRANRILERLGTRDLLFTYYTRDRLMSPAARAAWMEPDLRALP
ncbi:MAG: hypothetical protein ACAI18_17595 [Gemmatimonadales bacterium]